jgi:hypothetical protein
LPNASVASIQPSVAARAWSRTTSKFIYRALKQGLGIVFTPACTCAAQSRPPKPIASCARSDEATSAAEAPSSASISSAQTRRYFGTHGGRFAPNTAAHRRAQVTCHVARPWARSRPGHSTLPLLGRDSYAP